MVYRTCYDDEAAWQTWRTRLDDNVRSSLEWDFSGEELDHLVERHQPVVMDDRAQFGGVDLVTLRDHFHWWSRDDLEKNLEERPIDEKRSWTSEFFHQGTRYTVFAAFDDICVESMHRIPRAPAHARPPGLEALVRGRHERGDGWGRSRRLRARLYDHSEGPGGWIYQDAASYTTLYHRLRDINDWSEGFRYPSQVYTSMLLLERPPAFSREERAASIKEASSHRLE